LNELLAMVALDDREELNVFCVHETVTDCAPVPLAGETVSQEPFPAAVQLPPWQPLGDPVRVTLCEPAFDEGFAEDGLIVNDVQVGGALTRVSAPVSVKEPSVWSPESMIPLPFASRHTATSTSYKPAEAETENCRDTVLLPADNDTAISRGGSLMIHAVVPFGLRLAPNITVVAADAVTLY
jgi:hypothetical protein